ncbi:helix-turn-helix domain-containing protein, partial [Amycolatopsis sp. NPDC051071]|uniref:helix-turn-helix domain-containing protein n=1 Tax=Amycolatopsis sp. NPDC051071 TaxID=3154637 RepID=UPI003431BE6F
MAFGPELRRQRLAAGLSLTELAARIHYSRGYLDKVENGTASPNAVLAELCDAEFSGDGSLAAILPSDAERPPVPAPVLPRLRMELPPLTPGFHDRAREVEDVRAALLRDDAGSAAVCAVSGLSGVGKTALVLRCAHHLRSRFTDGCLFLDLRSHSPGALAVEPAAALDRFLRLLGVAPDEIPDELDDRAGAFHYRLRGRRVLIVLDNAATAAQVRPLIPAEPNCRVLVTSRNLLGALDDARHVPLRALPRPEAAELFRSLVAPRREHEAETVAYRIADHCGRSPLALGGGGGGRPPPPPPPGGGAAGAA